MYTALKSPSPHSQDNAYYQPVRKEESPRSSLEQYYSAHQRDAQNSVHHNTVNRSAAAMMKDDGITGSSTQHHHQQQQQARSAIAAAQTAVQMGDRGTHTTDTVRLNIQSADGHSSSSTALQPGTSTVSGGASPSKTRLTTSSVDTSSSGASATPRYSSFEIGIAVMAYASISLCIVYFNWWLFTDGFKYPVFVSWFQQIIGAGMYCIFACCGRVVPVLSNFPCIKPNLRTAIRILPLAISFVLMVAFANICLKYVHVSTYQVARSLTIIMTIILSYGILGQKESRSIVGSCLVMVLGFIVGSLDPSTLSLGGVITGACSSVSQAFYNVIIKKSLVYVDNNTNVMLLYNQLISSLLFIPVIFMAGEAPGVRQNLPLSLEDPNFVSVWSSLVFSGFLAATMNVAAYMCVKMTSPLTFNIVGVTKSLVQSLGGFVFLGDAVTVQSLGGIMLSLCGSAYYSFIKTMEKEHAKRLAAKAEGTAVNVMMQGTQELNINKNKGEALSDDDESHHLLNTATAAQGAHDDPGAHSKQQLDMYHGSNVQRSRHLASPNTKEV